jgi:hypothetical protein
LNQNLRGKSQKHYLAERNIAIAKKVVLALGLRPSGALQVSKGEPNPIMRGRYLTREHFF